MNDLLIVVPVRAGSVAVPRKGQQMIGGQPLVARTLTALHDAGNFTPHEITVVVSTDDPVVAEIAAQHHVPVIARPAELAAADVTLAAVVQHAAEALDHKGRIGCAQVTSPLLDPRSIGDMVTVFCDGPYTTASTVVAEHDLRWHGDTLLGEQVVRQQQAVVTQRETGGLRLWSSPNMLANGIASVKHLRWEVPEVEGADIDTPRDLRIVRDDARRRRILFVVEAGEDTGSGHLHRCLTLIDHLAGHHVEVCFVADPPAWAWDAVETHGGIEDAFSVTDGDIVACALDRHPADVVVFDKLDTSIVETGIAKAGGAGVVTLEDAGQGAVFADVTVNELLPGSPLSGPSWSVLRPEFCGPYTPPPGDGSVLVTFGGTDPAGLNLRVANLLRDRVWYGGLMSKVTVVAPPGLYVGNLDLPDGVTWVKTREVPMAALMRKADVVVTSQGRTVTEAMAMGRPVVSIAANVRELSHFHHEAVTYLGGHWGVSDERIVAAVSGLIGENGARVGAALRDAVDRGGAERIARLIEQVAGG